MLRPGTQEQGKEEGGKPKEEPPVAPGQPIAKPGKELDLADLPPMPAGWKPGDPLPDLADLPPMPPGWKPGDELPEIASIATAPTHRRRAEEPEDVPRPSRTLPSAFDFILNPDMEEVEEDYSSDEEDEDEDE
jgi:hypothetical protein